MARVSAFVFGLFVMTGGVVIADEPGPPDRPAVLRGLVTDQAGTPLADVRVRVAIPAADMRFVGPTTPHKQVEAATDAGGIHRMEIPGIAEPTTISIDAMKPGYERLVGTLMRGGDARRVEVKPGAEATADLRLRPGLYFSGVVVDEQGKPIPSVKVSSNCIIGRGSAGVERTATGLDGSFEIFSYPEKPPAIEGGATKGIVSFFHPDYIDTQSDDVYALAPEARRSMRIVLPTGYKVSGTVLDVHGKPVAGGMIKAARKDGTHRKGTTSDANGRFALRGLSPGLTLLSVRSLPIKQKHNLPMALNGDKEDLEVRLRPIAFPVGGKRYEVLGMELVDVTPEWKAAYDLYDDRGALIVDPGKDSDRLGIGELREGYVFWLVGEQRIGSVREFVDRLVAEAALQGAGDVRVRVVYTFGRVDFDGTNTQYMKLTKDDVDELKAISERLRPGGE